MIDSKRDALTRYRRMPSDRAITAVKAVPSIPLWRPDDVPALRRRGRIGTAANQARALLAKLDRADAARRAAKGTAA